MERRGTRQRVGLRVHVPDARGDPKVEHVLQPVYAKIRRVRAIDAKTLRVVFHE